jgi:asparagine N-glycosylation enzyme membrane subunit Stt3
MHGAPERNPLGPVVGAFVITLPFDYDSYLIHRDLSEFGILIIVTKVVFFVLYLLRSRFTWHVGFALTAVVTALALLLIRRGFKARELDCSLRHFFELAVAVPLGFYQWRIREQYFRYIQNRRANFSVH